MVQINNELIAEIAKKSSTAEDFLLYAANRERNVREGISLIPSVRSLMEKEGFHPVPKDLMDMFKALQDAGIGVLKGKEFKWNTSIREVGKAALAGAKEPSPKVEAALVSPRLPQSTKHLEIVLGHKEISIKFSGKLNRDEVNLIALKLLKASEE